MKTAKGLGQKAMQKDDDEAPASNISSLFHLASFTENTYRSLCQHRTEDFVTLQTMTASPDTARFRSATDFPKSIQELEPTQVGTIYEEMRDCLIFTNRSRAQLVRRNSEHKETTLQLRDRLTHFQDLIDRLKNQKQAQLHRKRSNHQPASGRDDRDEYAARRTIRRV